MKYLHPETKAVLEELPIPKDLRQQKIDFGKDGKATKKEWVINKKFDPDKLMMLQWGIFRLLFSNYDKPKEFLNMFIGLMPATAANIRLHVKNSVDSHHGFGGPASDGKPSYSFDSEPSGLTLKYQIGDAPRDIIKGKELCRAAADILNMIIIQPDFEEYIELEHEPEPKPDDTTKEFYFEYFKMYQGVDFPKGVTPTCIDKVKDDIINSDFFEELCSSAKTDGSKKYQNECAKNFFDHCSDVLKSKGIIKI